MTITRRELLAGAALLPAARAFAWVPDRPRPRDVADAALPISGKPRISSVVRNIE